MTTLRDKVRGIVMVLSQKEENMDRYLIETPHTCPECLVLIKQINAQGYLWNFDWGYKAGVHSGWAIIQAEDETQARLAVPPLVRSRARIIKLNKFDATTIEHYEKQDGTGGGANFVVSANLHSQPGASLAG